MSVRLLVGDCRAMLATLPDASAHMVCTSSPYYGLRAYGTNPQVWGGDPACGHVWDVVSRRVQSGGTGEASAKQITSRGTLEAQREVQQGSCTRCAAWRGELGSEPTPEQFVANLVAVFREVRRVLHPSGTALINLGDSYSSNNPPGRRDAVGTGFKVGKAVAAGGFEWDQRNRGTGLPPKNLLMMPARVAMALQADGWYLRSAMPWLKRAAMPESVTDRPSNALEWLFLFSKQARYFWDAEAIRQPHTAAHIQQQIAPPKDRGEQRQFAKQGLHDYVNPAGRAFRNTDPWFLGLDAAIADARADLARLEVMRATGGVLTDGEGLPLAVDINPAAYKEAHFATYPPALVMPFVKAGTSERGCCPRCLTPWGRVVERTGGPPRGDHRKRGDFEETQYSAGAHPSGVVTGGALAAVYAKHGYAQTATLGWAASCACEAGDPIPTTVLDPFAGSGTTLLVADRLGRDAIGIELSPEYARMAEARIAGDAPMLAEVETTAGDYAPLGLFEEVAG